jgi:LysM repeat protein
MLRRIGLLFLTFALLVSAVGFTVKPAAAAATCTQWYTVKYGDTLYKIGVKYGVSWKYLQQINHISNPNKIYAGQTICVATSTSGGTTTSSAFPYFFITSVVRDNKVTITGYRYPANTKFTVYMGPYGTLGVGGYYVTSFNTGAGGTITKTFMIPPELYGHTKIAIRTQDTPWFAYNWFWNTTAY